MVEPGEEEVWEWRNFPGHLDILEFLPGTKYVTWHELPGVGVRVGDKVTALEIAKIAFYVAPAPLEYLGVVNRWVRWELVESPIEDEVTSATCDLTKLWKDKRIIWMYTSSMLSAMGGEDNRTDIFNFPKMWDVTAPNGQGILVCQPNIWSMFISGESWPALPYTYSHCWRVLSRIVLVDPVYALKRRMANRSEGGAH